MEFHGADTFLHQYSLPPSPQLTVEEAPAAEKIGIDQEKEVATAAVEKMQEPTTSDAAAAAAVEVEEESGRERLKRHRREVAGRVWIPEIWGQEELLKDWADCTAFDACLFPSGIGSARAALVEEGRRANNGGFRLENRC